MAKFKGRFFSRPMMGRKGLKWTAELFLFEFSVLALAYQSVEFTEAIDYITSNTLRAGGKLENIYNEFTAMRNAASYINMSDESNTHSKQDLAQLQRMNFDVVKFISIIRRMRNNSIQPSQVNRYLVILIRELNVNNAQLRNFISLIHKFERIPAKQQIEATMRIRNYAAIHFKGAESTLISSALYKHLVTTYNTDVTYSDDNEKVLGMKPDTLAKAAAVGLIALGTKKMTTGILNTFTDRKSGESWASKIAGKANHKGFDDTFR